MNQSSLRRFGSKLALLAVIALPSLANAQFFNFNQFGDVLTGFRKTGNNAGNYDLVIDLGSVTNFLNVTAGTTITVSNVNYNELTNSFPVVPYLGNLQWSVFAAFPNSSPWVTPLWTFPANTLWYTQPAPDVNTQSTPPDRLSANTQVNTKNQITGGGGVGGGAFNISETLATNVNNNTFLVREPLIYTANVLDTFMADPINNTTNGDFGGNNTPLPTTVENTTPSSFTTADRCDFYQLVPTNKVDPISLSTSNAYFIGYFILNASGTMTFTRASAVTAPSAGTVASSVTNGFAPLTVVFTNTATGSITNWVWNFGNGTSITNTTGANATNTYAAGGSYTVTLTVYGPGGTNSVTYGVSIVTSPLPRLNVSLAAGKFVFTGTNCPATVQYRILNTTNISTALTNWTPVFTNQFLSNGNFAYTNAMTNLNGYFRLVSP